MIRVIRFVVFGMLFGACGLTAFAEGTPAPPNWQDCRGASVYLGTNQPPGNPPLAKPASSPAPVQEPEILVTPSPASIAPIDSAKPITTVQQVSHEEVVPAVNPPSRHLAPSNQLGERITGAGNKTSIGGRKLINFGLPTESIFTVVTGLVIVTGAFLLFAWALRRGGKQSGFRNGILPQEAVSVLGRVTYAPRQIAQLLRVGNKLVLVAITPSGPTTLTEVTEASEVDRLVGLCQQHDRHSTSKEFEKVFAQFSKEPVSGFLGEEALPASLSPAASAYRSQRGTARA